MSLDLTILDAHTPIERVAIGVDVHWRLCQLALAAKLPQLIRLQDYYEDVEFSQKALPALLEEVQTLLVTDNEEAPELLALLVAIDRICRVAIKANLPLVAQAD